MLNDGYPLFGQSFTGDLAKPNVAKLRQALFASNVQGVAIIDASFIATDERFRLPGDALVGELELEL